jgi:hypothetical protein
MNIDKNTYNVNNMIQLIDLNKDIVNFNLNFKTECENPEQVYQLVVVDQITLDNGEPLSFKTAKGSLSGNIVSDKDMYKNYLLVLKSENECKIKVEIDCKPIIKEQPKEELITPNFNSNFNSNSNSNSNFNFNSNFFSKIFYKYKIRIIVIVIVIVCISLLYKKYGIKQSHITEDPLSNELDNDDRYSMSSRSPSVSSRSSKRSNYSTFSEIAGQF